MNTHDTPSSNGDDPGFTNVNKIGTSSSWHEERYPVHDKRQVANDSNVVRKLTFNKSIAQQVVDAYINRRDSNVDVYAECPRYEPRPQFIEPGVAL